MGCIFHCTIRVINLHYIMLIHFCIFEIIVNRVEYNHIILFQFEEINQFFKITQHSVFVVVAYVASFTIHYNFLRILKLLTVFLLHSIRNNLIWMHYIINLFWFFLLHFLYLHDIFFKNVKWLITKISYHCFHI